VGFKRLLDQQVVVGRKDLHGMRACHATYPRSQLVIWRALVRQSNAHDFGRQLANLGVKSCEGCLVQSVKVSISHDIV
jgi:hypothetical protein